MRVNPVNFENSHPSLAEIYRLHQGGRFLEIGGPSTETFDDFARYNPCSITYLDPALRATENGVVEAFYGFGMGWNRIYIPGSEPQVITEKLQDFCPGEPFDVVIARGVFGRIGRDDWKGIDLRGEDRQHCALRKLQEIVKPGGLLQLASFELELVKGTGYLKSAATVASLGLTIEQFEAYGFCLLHGEGNYGSDFYFIRNEIDVEE